MSILNMARLSMIQTVAHVISTETESCLAQRMAATSNVAVPKAGRRQRTQPQAEGLGVDQDLERVLWA